MRQEIASSYMPGFYLVRESDGMRFFISEDLDHRRFERVANRALNEDTGYEYWVDRCLGLDVHENVAWSNLDWTDHFLHQVEVFSD